jgi:Cu/Ag efflux protein CusF
MKATHFVPALLLLAASCAGAQTMSMPMKPKAPAGARATVPTVDAEVRKLDAGKGLIVLKHGEIANLGMGPMTMGFRVADEKMLKGLKVGDKVRFQAEMVKGEPTVTHLRAIR